jgi:hypothetical protein
MVAPICTVGPSRPSARPDPIASTPPMNLIGTTARGALAAAMPARELTMTTIKQTARYSRYLLSSLSTVAFGLNWN